MSHPNASAAPTPGSRPLPANTIVVMPRQPAAGKASLWLLFWTIGLLTGLFARTLLGETASSAPSSPAQVVAASTDPILGPAPTVEMHLRAVLELPTHTPAPPPTPSPSPTASSLIASNCTTPEPGIVCQVPQPPPPTPTPYPSCERMDELSPGAWCRWPVNATGTLGWERFGSR